MKERFVELVFDCPFILLKGFLIGFIACGKSDVEYFFGKKDGIESDTFKESLKEWLGIESHVHLFVKKRFAGRLKKAVEKFYDKLGVSVVSEREIKEAFFTFSCGFFEEKALKDFQKRIEEYISSCGDCKLTFETKEGFEPVVDDFGGGMIPFVPSRRYFLNGEVRGYLPSVVKVRKSLVKGNFGDISKVSLVF